MVVVFFFFKQKTAYEMRISDWSSDVCSSDLLCRRWTGGLARPGAVVGGLRIGRPTAQRAGHPQSRTAGRGVVCSRRPGRSAEPAPDRKSVVEGKSVSLRVDRGGRRIIKKKNTISIEMIAM